MSELEKKEVVSIEQVQNENTNNFVLMQRRARLLADSDIIPYSLKGKVSDCFLMLDLADRMSLPILTVLQNVYVIQGKPSLSTQFLIASFNKTGRFSTINYRLKNKGKVEATIYKGKGDKRTSIKKQVDNITCVAYCTELSTGNVFESAEVSVELAIAENWYSKDGSKWQTMAEQMLRYRSAVFLIRSVAPEVSLGLHTEDEVRDMQTPTQQREYKVIEMDDKKDTAEVVDDVEIITNDVDVDASKSNSISVEDFINNNDDEVNDNV